MNKNSFDLSGKTALVTGANTGLGQGIAIALAQAGADIALIGRSTPTETLEKLSSIGVKTHSIHADLGKADNVKDIISEAVSNLKRADILSKRNNPVKSSILPQCLHSKGAFACLLTQLQKAAWAD